MSHDPALPVTAASGPRITAVDVLRGVSILIILPINIQSFAMLDVAVQNPYAAPWTDAANLAAWGVTHVLFGMHALAVFSILFGAGVVWMDRNARAHGWPPAAVHYRRMGVLLALGLVHAYAVWHGDILVAYALCGAAVYPLRRLRPGWLMAGGLATYAVALGVLWIMQRAVPLLPENMSESIYASFQPGPEQVAAHDAAYRSGWLGQMQARIPNALNAQIVLFGGILFWMCSGMMLAGMALLRWRVLSGELPARIYGWMLGAGTCIGLSLTLYGVYRNFDANWDPTYSLLGGRIYQECASPFLAAACIGGTMLWCRAGLLPGLTRRLAAVGRMALSCYLMHSVVCAFIFYGSGLGLVHRVDRVGQLAITAGVWIVEVAACAWWLERFSLGPVEWLWRRLAYGRGSMRPASAFAAETGAYGVGGAAGESAMAGGRIGDQAADAQAGRRRVDTAGAGAARAAGPVVKLLAFIGLLAAAHVVAMPLMVHDFTAQLGLAAAAVAATWVAGRWLEGRGPAALGLGLSGRGLALLLGAALGGVGLVAAALALCHAAGGGVQVAPAKWPGLAALGSAACFWCAAAAYEELICRGYPFRVLARWNLPIAMLISGVVFVVPHLRDAGDNAAMAVVNLSLAHVLYVALYLRTASLWPLIGLHAGWNFALAAIFGMPLGGDQFEAAFFATELRPGLWAGGAFGLEAGLAVTVVLGAAAAAAWGPLLVGFVRRGAGGRLGWAALDVCADHGNDVTESAPLMLGGACTDSPTRLSRDA